MSDPVTIVRSLLDAYERGGARAALEHLHDDLRIFPALPSGEPVLRGRAEYEAHHARLAEQDTELEADYDHFEDLGEGRVLVGGEVRVRRPEGEHAQRAFWVMTVSGDQVVSIAAHADRDEALRSVGRFS